jgi:hypothetical protein
LILSHKPVFCPLVDNGRCGVAEDKPDWADELAKDMLAETLVILGATSSAEARRLIAMRFRLVKEQGFGEGLDTAVAVIKSGAPGSPAAVSDA